MDVGPEPKTFQQLLCHRVGTDAAMYLRESGIITLVSFLEQGGKACWYHQMPRLSMLAEELVDLYLLEKEASDELEKASTKQHKIQETIQLLGDLLARVPKDEQAPRTNYEEWRQKAGKPRRFISNPRHRNLGPSRLNKAALPEPEAPADAAESQDLAATRPRKLRPITVGQAALLRLKAAQPSTKECKEVAAQVSYWMSRLAVIHRQQQEVQDDMLQTWRSAFTQLDTQQQLQDATAQLEAAQYELFKVKVLAETKADLAKERQEQLEGRLSAAEAEVAAHKAQQQHQQQQQAEFEQQMQQRLAAAEAKAADYKQQLLLQQVEMQQMQQQQQEPVHPVQVTLKLQSDAAQLQHMAAQLAAAQAASAVVQQQQQQQQRSKPQVAADAEAAVASASLSLAPVVPAGMSREEQQQQPDTPVVEQQTVELEFSSSRQHMRCSSWGDSDSGSVFSSRHSSRRSSRDGDTMAAVQQAVGQVATQLQQQAASLAASSAQVFNSLISSEATADGAYKQLLDGQLSRSNSSGSVQTAAGPLAAADQSSSRVPHTARSTDGSSRSRSEGSCDSAAACDAANKAAGPAPKGSAAGGRSSGSMQHSQSAVHLTAPPAAASNGDSVGFVPEFAAQLGRWASAWLGAQSVPHCQWLPTAGYHQRRVSASSQAVRHSRIVRASWAV